MEVDDVTCPGSSACDCFNVQPWLVSQETLMVVEEEVGVEEVEEVEELFGAFFDVLVGAAVASWTIPIDSGWRDGFELLLASLDHEPKRLQRRLTGAGAQSNVFAGQSPRWPPLAGAGRRRIALLFRAADRQRRWRRAFKDLPSIPIKQTN